MNNKKLALVLAVVIMMSIFATACKNEQASLVITTPNPDGASATATIAPSVEPTAEASPTEATQTELATPNPEDDFDEIFVGSFKDLVKNNDVLVIRGQFTEKLPELWNQIRDIDDPSKPDPLLFNYENQFKFKISDVYKNVMSSDELKKDDEVLVNFPFKRKLPSDKSEVLLPGHFEPELNKDVVIIMAYSTDLVPNTLIIYPFDNPYYFEVVDNKLIAKSYSDDIVAKWNKAVGTDSGVPLANLTDDIKSLEEKAAKKK